jgi:hypothetical protein
MIDDIKRAIAQLSPRELARFRVWFNQFDTDRFDEILRQDVETGKLDAFAEEALDTYRAGQTRDV